jgi:transcriptional regulator with GAF, ATPase, and Fis domain
LFYPRSSAFIGGHSFSESARRPAAVDHDIGAGDETRLLDRLERCGWSQTEASESLHVPLSTLNQKIKRLDIKIRKKSEA